MTSKDINRLAVVERNASTYLAELGYEDLASFGDFPFKNMEDVRLAHDVGAIRLFAPYHEDGLDLLGTSSERARSLSITICLFVVAIGNLSLAIYNHSWFYLLGVVFEVAGFSLATPYNRLRPLIIVLTLMGFAVTIFTANWPWFAVALSFLLGAVASMSMRLIHQVALRKRALHSEPLLCFMLLKGIIFLIEPESGLPWQHNSVQKVAKG